MYNIGDKVVYPMHGAGIIEAIEEKRILKQREQYYIMKMPFGDMTVMIPVSHSDEIGIRSVISKKEAESVLERFRYIDVDLTLNWNKRYRENMEKIKEGDILEVAEVVKSLMLREKMRGLSTGERKMLTTARHIFISELVLSQIDDCEGIENCLEKMIDEILND